jgi:hypothetical protein
MRRKMVIGAVAAVCAFAIASSSWAANHVRIDKLSNVAPNATGVTIGVYVTNDVPINGFVLPLEIRTWSGGAYMAGATITRGLNPTGRMNLSPLGAADDGGQWPAANLTQRTFAATVAVTGCQRRIAGPMGDSWNTAAAQPDFVSPDAIFHAGVSTGDPNIGELTDMEPGADPEGTPSYRIICNVNGSTGMFVIDTTCVAPANHLSFTQNVDGVPVPVVPTFEHGIVGINTIASVQEIETGNVPESYMLEQNYPNPFNAGTVIRFAQPVDGHVKIDVFNILGRKVKTLVNEFRSAGTHQADWDGRSDDGIEVATGVYFYRITTDAFTSTRKMVLLK